jgi:hypothetical protein
MDFVFINNLLSCNINEDCSKFQHVFSALSIRGEIQIDGCNMYGELEGEKEV